MKKEGKTCLRQGRKINYLKTCKRGHGWPKLKKIKMDFNSFFSFPFSIVFSLQFFKDYIG